MTRVVGIVREWHDEDGWGVIDSPQTPGGCWTHFSSIAVAGTRALAPGQRVVLEWEAPGQDHFAYRVTRVWPDGSEPTDEVPSRPGAAYRSGLFLSSAVPPEDISGSKH